MPFVPLFTAQIISGIVTYHSRQTGYHYHIKPDIDGFNVDCPEAHLNIWTANRVKALNYVQMVDLARLASL